MNTRAAEKISAALDDIQKMTEWPVKFIKLVELPLPDKRGIYTEGANVFFTTAFVDNASELWLRQLLSTKIIPCMTLALTKDMEMISNIYRDRQLANRNTNTA